MTHHLNTNKQFMIGNGILAFAVIFVVVIFVYMSLRFDFSKMSERHYAEQYGISLTSGFAGDSLTVMINDSILFDGVVGSEPLRIESARFAEESALLIVEKSTDNVSTFNLSEKGGEYRFERDADGVKQLAQ
jgi:hypothetical protein